MKKIIYIIIIILIIGLELVYNFYKNKENYVEIENPTTQNIETEKKISNIRIHITGEVKHPGIIEIEEGSRIADAIEIAGGATDIADISKVNLAYKLEDGEKIYIPSIYDKEEQDIICSDAGQGVSEIDNTKENTININKASQGELETLPGIGEATALNIIEYRKINGKFKSIEDLKNVQGIGNSKFENIKDKISV